jgi:alpha-galactosidase
MMHVEFDASRPGWRLIWADLELHLVLFRGVLQSLYFGPQRPGPVTVPETPHVDSLCQSRSEATISLGTRDEMVVWESAEGARTDPARFELVLRARDYPLEARLTYAVDPATGFLERRNLVRHTGRAGLHTVEGATSFAVRLPADVSALLFLAGGYGREAQPQRLPLTPATVVLESRNGKTGYDYAPYLALESPRHTYLAMLNWSGNWQMSARRIGTGCVDVSGGPSEWGLAETLAPGETVALPGALLGCVPGDLEAATGRLHETLRAARRDSGRPLPTQFCSWGVCPAPTPSERLKDHARRAAEIGLEVFMLDAGWYTTQRDGAGGGVWTSRGDWLPNPAMFPDGLTAFSDYCRGLGLQFGIWFEPETVDESAWVRAAHPEWLHPQTGFLSKAYGGRVRALHLGVPAARAWVRDRIGDILAQTRATWMKWDFNIELAQGGWAPGLPRALTRRDPLAAHYRGLYRLQAELRERFPELILEMCAGGGGRFDQAVLAQGHTMTLSDAAQALPNLAIHFGRHRMSLPLQRNAFQMDWPARDPRGAVLFDERPDLAFRLRVLMLGGISFGYPLERWSAAECDLARRHIAFYKETLRPLLRDGEAHALGAHPCLTGDGDWAAMWHVAKNGDSGVLLAFRLAAGTSRRRFALCGLDERATYGVVDMDGGERQATGRVLAAGIGVSAPEPFRSVLLSVRRCGPDRCARALRPAGRLR